MTPKSQAGSLQPRALNEKSWQMTVLIWLAQIIRWNFVFSVLMIFKISLPVWADIREKLEIKIWAEFQKVPIKGIGKGGRFYITSLKPCRRKPSYKPEGRSPWVSLLRKVHGKPMFWLASFITCIKKIRFLIFRKIDWKWILMSFKCYSDTIMIWFDGFWI